MRVYLEVGEKKAFAVALDWIGLARSGRTDDEALAALLEYVPRYKTSMGQVAAGFDAPSGVSALDVVERLEGNATTDFGAPGVIPDADRRDIAEDELEKSLKLLGAAWHAFDVSVLMGQGRTLTPSGPRGGGRSLERMQMHVLEADEGYTSAIGGRASGGTPTWTKVQERFVETVRARAAGELPDVGPRGGQRWPALYAVRRSAWHSLDHAWEIEDRLDS
jgi:hypothetical protein